MKKINAHYTPKPLPVEYTRYADPKTICHGQIVADCLKGDLTSNKEVLVLGDSHAAMLNHFFDYLGKELGFKARIITASSCVTIPGFNYQHIAEWAHKPCLAQIKEAEKHIPEVESIFLAGMWDWQLMSKDFEKDLARFLYNNSNENLFVLGQVPHLKHHPRRSQRFINLGLKTKSEINLSYLKANNKLEVLVQNTAVSFVNLSTLRLFDAVPIYKGKPLYFDEHHLNEFGATEYAKQVLASYKDLAFD